MDFLNPPGVSNAASGRSNARPLGLLSFCSRRRLLYENAEFVRRRFQVQQESQQEVLERHSPRVLADF
jgi:hypothetical protein